MVSIEEVTEGQFLDFEFYYTRVEQFVRVAIEVESVQDASSEPVILGTVQSMKTGPGEILDNQPLQIHIESDTVKREHYKTIPIGDGINLIDIQK